MPFSSLQYLTVVQLKSIAKDFNVSYVNNIKKAELIELLANILPADFDVAQYVRIDMLNSMDKHSFGIKSNTKYTEDKIDPNKANPSHNIATTESSQSNIDFSNSPTENEHENDDKGAFESALFDVTNYEPRKNKQSSPVVQNTFIPPHPQITAKQNNTYGKSRFGPKASFSPPQALNFNSNIAQTKEGNIQNKVFKQAYTSVDSRPMPTPSNKPSIDSNKLIPQYNINQDNIDIHNPTLLLNDHSEIPVHGILKVNNEGYGYLTSSLTHINQRKIYVSNGMIQRYHLKNGDVIDGTCSTNHGLSDIDILAFIDKINNQFINRFSKKDKTVISNLIFPNTKIKLESDDNSASISMRLIDFVSPLHFGQRVLLLSQPNTGLTSLLIDLANTIQKNNQGEVIFLNIDSTPEEAAYLKQSLHCRLYSATFDLPCEEQINMAEITLEDVVNKSDLGIDVILIIDSFSKLIQLCQDSQTQNSTNPTFTPQSLNRTKQIFSMAKNSKDSGSITLITGMNYDTGNKLDNLLAEKFIEKANASIFLDKELSDRFLFPAINLKRSILKRPDMTLSAKEFEMYKKIHKIFNVVSSKQSITQFIDLISKTKNNDDLKNKLPEWLNIWEKLSNI